MKTYFGKAGKVGFMVLFVSVMISGGMARGSAASDQVAILEAFGASTGIALYDIQVIVGMTADAYYKKTYNKAESTQIVSEQEGALGVLKQACQKLINTTAISKTEKDSVKSIVVCIDKLNATIKAIKDYLNNPTQKNADAFQVKRKASYAAIADLLGLEN